MYEIEHLSHPKTIVTDFELAILNAVKIVWPVTQFSLCYFHLTQSIYRHIQQAGLVVTYQNHSNVKFRQSFFNLKALPFVKLCDIEKGK